MRVTFFARYSSIVIATLVAVGCGEGGRSPVGPSSASPPIVGPPGSPSDVQIGLVVTGARSELRVTWEAVPGATGYTVLLGRSSGTNDLGSFDVDRPSFTTSALEPGRVVAQVRARNESGTSPPSAEVTEWFFDFRHFIEALFLGTGPLTPRDGNHGCSATGWVRGFPAGTEIGVLVSNTVASDRAGAIKGIADQIALATNGVLRARFVEAPEPNPLPTPNQQVSIAHPAPSSQGCPNNNGCAIHTFIDAAKPGRFLSSRAIQAMSQTAQSYAHEVGHGALGLCHVDGTLIGGARHSLMSAGPGVYSNFLPQTLSTYDVAALQALYGAGISAGARRQDLISAGLVTQ